jgi:hypothetical protein
VSGLFGEAEHLHTHTGGLREDAVPARSPQVPLHPLAPFEVGVVYV